MTCPTDAVLTTQIINPIYRSAQETFQNMLGSGLQRTELSLQPFGAPFLDVTAVIGLSGEATGSICLSFPKQTALNVVERLVELRLDEIDDLVRDSVGELANMIGGGTKEKLAGLSLRLGLPQLLSGSRCLQAFPQGLQPLALQCVSDLGPLQIVFGFCRSTALSLLIADADSVSRSVIRKTARALGYDRIFEAATGPAARQILAQENIDLLFVADALTQPVASDPVHFARQRQPQLPIVLLVNGSAKKLAGHVPCDDRLLAPFTPASLNSTITRWLSYPLIASPAEKQISTEELIAC